MVNDKSDFPSSSGDSTPLLFGGGPLLREGASGDTATGSLMLLPESVLGSFHIINLVGCSRMGEAWMAFDSEANREVILKVIHRQWTQKPAQMNRVLEIGRQVQQLNHPNIIKMYSCGQIDGIAYFAMEQARGSLLQRINRKGKLPVPDCMAALLAVVSALKYAAQYKVVHGDVKPANVLLMRGGGIKLADFALAQAGRENITPSAPEFPITGAEYMSPEAVKGQGVDFRSDIYSLGISFYQMVTGKLPFTGSIPEVMQQQVQRPLPDPNALSSEYGRGLAEVLLRMTAKRMDERYDNYDELIESLNYINDNGADSSPYPFDTSSSEFSILEDSSVGTAQASGNGNGVSSEAVTPVLAELSALSDSLEEEKPAPNRTVPPTEQTPIAIPQSPLMDHTPVAIPQSHLLEETPMALPGASLLDESAFPVHDHTTAHEEESIAVYPPLMTPSSDYKAERTPPPTATHVSVPRAAGLSKLLVIAAVLALVFMGGGIYGIWKHYSTKTDDTAHAEALLRDLSSSQHATQPTAQPPVPAAVEATALPAAPLPAATGDEPAVGVPPPLTAVAAKTPPAQPASSTTAPGEPIVVDDADPDSLILLPTAETWRPSSEPRRSYANGSLVTRADGTKKSATFRASIPADGVYDVQLFWVSSGPEFRSEAVPVFVHTSEDIKKVVIDQVSLGDQFQSLGKFPLKAGVGQPVVSISTAGVPPGATTFISVDALKLVPVVD